MLFSKAVRWILVILLIAVSIVARPASTPAQAQPDGDVAILVVDVFEHIGNWERIEGGNCLVTPEGAAKASIAGTAKASIAGTGGTYYPQNGLLEHGQVVYGQLFDLLAQQADLSDVVRRPVGFMPEYSAWNAEGSSIYLAAVDTVGYRSDITANNIDEAIRLFAGMGVTGIVINMSFALVPCADASRNPDPLMVYQAIACDEMPEMGQMFGGCGDTLTRLQITKAAGDDSMLQQMAQYAYDNGRGDIGDLLSQALNEGWFFSGAMDFNHPVVRQLIPFAQVHQSDVPGGVFSAYMNEVNGDEALGSITNDGPGAGFLNGDPLLGKLYDLRIASGPQLRVIPVASSGNHGGTFDFPFAPAIWLPVLGISASDGQERAGWSNPGEVMMSQSYTFRGDNPLASQSSVYPDSTGTVFGTSFSAPYSSFEAAYYLLRGGAVPCGGSAGGTPLTYPGWENLSRPDAANAFCQGFNNLAP